ncbi:threonine aldolase family protein [Photobacterium sanguinicancri]|uniref:threonine aldolase family protein n=1 Tax=Photobacterium sanguinicancri TaxID=875932 RepID=UPI0021C44277|nr:beta-eliminating lyase-related protein [Photobacterium sanguinicancri]
MGTDLRNQCHTVLSGHTPTSPATLFQQMADWCSENRIEHDMYGEGDLIQGFEQKVADLLGFESGLFVITGTMTQPTALQLACHERNNPVVAMHPSSHIYLRERQGYQVQQRFTVLPVGDPHKTWTLDDLQHWPDDISVVLYELPMREIGGQLPKWDDLQAIKDHCQSNNIHLHMDGARLWECKAYYQREYKQIASGFDSVYVSLYKGLNGLGGSLLLGNKAYIEKARYAMMRQGGNVYRRSPYVVAAAMQFEQQLGQMPAYFERTQELYALLERYPRFTANPEQPHTNMLHLYLPVSVSRVQALRDKLAKEQQIWLGSPQSAPLKNQCFLEWYVGGALTAMPNEQLISILDWLNEQLSQ